MAPNPITISRCDPPAEKEALALAAQAWPEEERAAYWQTTAGLLRGGAADRVALIAAREKDQLLAAQLGQVLPGRVAVVWPACYASEKIAAAHPEIAVALGPQVLAALAASGAELAQSLVAPDDATNQARISEIGFAHSADLLYLVANLQDAPAIPSVPPFQLEPFESTQLPRLIALIERTYTGTLDCPGLDNLRNTSDVVAGYQAVGQFRPELWSFVRCDEGDVGCLLINLHPDVNHAEIVYLALVPEVRGRGWGYELALRARQIAFRAGCERVVLAVDAANQPAVNLYVSAGFEPFDRRSVWIKSLVKNPEHTPG